MAECNTYDICDSIAYCDCGEKIFTAGSYGDEMYIIHSGKVEISLMTDHGKQILAIVGKGGIFGEMALLSDTPRTATAVAIEPTTLLPFSREAMVARIESNPAFALSLITALSERLMNTTSRLVEQIEAVEKRYHEAKLEYTRASLMRNGSTDC